jgi:F-type H+-transporting ATPase subunit c
MQMRKVLSLLAVAVITFMATAAFAEGGAEAGVVVDQGWRALGAGLAIGLAAFGCGIGQGNAIGACLTGIARNPKADAAMFPKLILGLAIIESLAIYALIIAFMVKP